MCVVSVFFGGGSPILYLSHLYFVGYRGELKYLNIRIQLLYKQNRKLAEAQI